MDETNLSLISVSVCSPPLPLLRCPASPSALHEPGLVQGFFFLKRSFSLLQGFCKTPRDNPDYHRYYKNKDQLNQLHFFRNSC